jgi:hypothetical protein
LIPFLSVSQRVHLEDLRYKPRRVCVQGYLAQKSEVENAHPDKTHLGPWAWACGRVLGGCVFFQVRCPCTRVTRGEPLRLTEVDRVGRGASPVVFS